MSSDESSEKTGFFVPESAQGQRLDKVLDLMLSEGEGLRARRRFCEEGRVLVNGRPAPPSLKVRAGQCIELRSEGETSSSQKGATTDSFEGNPFLIHSENGLAAIFKPAGLHTTALAGSSSASLEAFLPSLFPSETQDVSVFHPLLLNRLDAPTSGIVLTALSEDGERMWRRSERRGLADKEYLAIIEGQPVYDFTVARKLDTDNRTRTRVARIDDPDPIRHTSITLLHAFTLGDFPELLGFLAGQPIAADAATPACLDMPLMLVGCRIHKGARHQIRAHLAAAGHPLLGDRLYGSECPLPDAVFRFGDSQFLLHHERIWLPKDSLGDGFEATVPAPWKKHLPL